MPISLLQAALVGGELSMPTQGRVDLDRFRTSLGKCENFIVRPTGGAVFRPGTEFVGQTPNGGRVLTLEFRASDDLQYLLELSDKTMRVIYRGGYVSVPVMDFHPTDAVTISATTTTVKATKVSGFSNQDIGNHLWYGLANDTPANADTRNLILGIDDGAAIIEYGDYDPAMVTPVAYGYWAVSNSASRPTEVLEFATPWDYEDLALLSFSQSADVMTVCHPDYPPQHIRRESEHDWKVVPAPIVNGPFGPWNIDESKRVKLTKSDTTGLVTAEFPDPAIPEGMVNSTIDIEPEVGSDHWQAGEDYVAGITVRSEGKYYKATTSGKSGTLRPSHTSGTFSDGGVKWTFLSRSSTQFRITAVSNVAGGLAKTLTMTPLNDEVPLLYASGAVTNPTKTFGFKASTISDAVVGAFTINTGAHQLTVGRWYRGSMKVFKLSMGMRVFDLDSISIFTLTPTMLRVYWPGSENYSGGGGTVTVSGGVAAGGAVAEAGVTYQWRLGAWSDYHGWPATVTYHQQRQVFGGNYDQPQMLWFSRVNAYTDFGVEFPRSDEDGFNLTLDAAEWTSICGLLSMSRLMVFTTGGEWVIGSAESGAPITLETARASMQCAWGSQPGLYPQLVGDASMFVQGKARTLRDLDYDYAKDRFLGNDLTVAAAHLFKGRRIVDWAFQKSPHSVVWCVMDDGGLVALTYLREQQVVAWHRHSTQGTVEGVSVVAEGFEDAVYFVVKRDITISPESFTADVVCEVQHYGGVRIPAPIVVTAQTGVFSTSSVGMKITIPDVERPVEVVSYVSPTQVVCEKYDIPLQFSAVSCSIAEVSRYVERLSDPDLDLWLDCAKTYTSTVSQQLTGLGHLEGESVMVQATWSGYGDKFYLGPFTVTGGAITVKQVPDANSYSYRVGLTYTGKLQTLDIDLPTQETTRTNQKILTGVHYLLGEARYPVLAGVAEDALYESVGDLPTAEEPSVVRVDLPSTWERKGRTTLVHNKPGPCEVLSIIPVVTLGGS